MLSTGKSIVMDMDRKVLELEVCVREHIGLIVQQNARLEVLERKVKRLENVMQKHLPSLQISCKILKELHDLVKSE